MKVYRVENKEKGQGLWRNFAGEYNPVFDRLSDGKARSLNMDDNPFYRRYGKKWFSAAPSKATLKNWFSKQDVIELRQYDYKIYEFDVKEIEKVSDFEVVFTRDKIVKQVEVSINEIFG